MEKTILYFFILILASSITLAVECNESLTKMPCNVSSSLTLNFGLSKGCNDTAGDGCFQINSSDISLDCNGSTIQGNLSLGSKFLNFNSKEGINITNCNFKYYTGQVDFYDGTIFENVTIRHQGNISGTEDFSFINTNITFLMKGKNGTSGLRKKAGTQVITINNSKFESNSSTAFFGWSVNLVSDVTIKNSIFYGVMQGEPELSVEGMCGQPCTFEHNVVNHSKHFQFHMFDITAFPVNIKNNKFYDSYLPIYVNRATKQVTNISNNTINNNPTSDIIVSFASTYIDCILVEDSNNVFVENNYIDANVSGYAIDFYNTVKAGLYNITVRNNVILLDDDMRGIVFGRHEQTSLIENNNITGKMSAVGIALQNSSNNIVRNNIINNTNLDITSGDCIQFSFQNNTDNNVINNTLINCPRAAIKLDGVHKSNFTDNTIENSFLYDFIIQNSNVSILNNIYIDGFSYIKQNNANVNITVNETSTSYHLINLSNDGTTKFNYYGRKDFKTTDNTIQIRGLTPPNNDIWNETGKEIIALNVKNYNVTIASNQKVIIKDLSQTSSFFNFTIGWNLVPQVNFTSISFTDIRTHIGINTTVLSYYNGTSRTFTSFINGSGFNEDYQVPSGDPYYAYAIANFTRVLNYTYVYRNYDLPIGWNLLFSKNKTNISIINESVGMNSSVISYWNNTNKLYKTAVTRFSVRMEQKVPYLESFWVYFRNETIWRR